MPVSRADRLIRSALLALLLAVVAPWPAMAADPTPTPVPSPTVDPSPSPEPLPTPSADPSSTPAPVAPDRSTTPPPLPAASPIPQPASASLFAVNLYRPYTIVRQYTTYWCVPANAQTMLNIINGTRDRTRRTQARYAWHIHRLNRYTYSTRGNDVTGWARLLDKVLPGDLHYSDRRYRTQDAAIAAIIESIDRTGHPVGIVVDRGSHAWTVLGYRLTMVRGDLSSVRVLGLYVSGSLYRSGDPWPYRYYTISQFKSRFTRYHEWQRRVVWEGQYVIVSE